MGNKNKGVLDDKEGYVLYKGWHPLFLTMSDEELGQLFRSIINYQEGLPTDDAPRAFEMVRRAFQKNEEKYIQKCETNRRNKIIGNLKGLTDEAFSARIKLYSTEDLIDIADRVKDERLKERIIIECGNRTNDTIRNDRYQLEIDSDSDYDSELESDFDSDYDSGLEKESEQESGMESGEDIDSGLVWKGDLTYHQHGSFQNVYLTDNEYSALVGTYGLSKFEKAADILSDDLRRSRDYSKSNHYDRIIEILRG